MAIGTWLTARMKFKLKKCGQECPRGVCFHSAFMDRWFDRTFIITNVYIPHHQPDSMLNTETVTFEPEPVHAGEFHDTDVFDEEGTLTVSGPNAFAICENHFEIIGGRKRRDSFRQP